MGRAKMLHVLFKGLQGLNGRPVPDESASEGLNILLHGRASYPLELVGSSRFQHEIRTAMGATRDAVRRRECVAALILDQAGPAGRTDVGVFIGGAIVGYFPRYLSTRYCEWLNTWDLSRAAVHCHAVILGDRNNAEQGGGEHRVKLDIEIPFKMTTIPF